MIELLGLARGALTLNAQTFDNLKQSPDVFRKGFTFVLVVGLIVGGVLGVVALIGEILTPPAQQIAQAREGFRQTFGYFSSAMPPEISRQVTESFEMGLRIGERVTRETRSPLPEPIGVIFRQSGAIVSYPFGWLGGLIFFGALVHIFAKLLGGRATIAQMLGVTSLTVVPHLLDAFGFIACLGALLGFIAWAWGVVIYIKGVAVAQEINTGKAILAVLLPFMVAFLFALLLLVSVGVLIAVASGGK